MPEFDIVEYLASKGYHGKVVSGGNEIAYPCFLGCGEPDHSTKRKLYVNAETGLYHCFVCEAFGGTTLLQRHFGDEQPTRTGPTGPVPGRRTAVLDAVVHAGQRYLAGDDDAMLYLVGENRWLPAQVILDRRLGYIDHRSLVGSLPIGEFTTADIEAANIVWASGPYVGRDFYRDSILIPYIQNGRVVQVRGKSLRDGGYFTGPGDASHLYNADALRNADECIIVEGEFDTMMLADLLSRSPDLKVRNIAVVGIPGVHSLPEDLDAQLENVRRIYVGTDPDEAGRKAADRLVERFGARATKLDWPERLLREAQADGYKVKHIDWTLWIGRYGATWADVLVMLRQSSRLASMAEAGSRFRNRPNTGVKLGFAELDSWIHPGLLPGQVMVPLARTGTGKTVWCCNLAHNLHDRKVLYISLEQTQEEIYMRLARIERFYRWAATDEEVEYSLSDLRICDQNRLTPADFAQLIDEYGESVGAPPELVIIDYLGYYARGMKGGSPYEKTSSAIMQLKEEAKRHRLSIIAPHQVNRLAEKGKPLDASDARDSGVVEETADFMLGIFRPADALTTDGASAMPDGKLRLSLLKSRHGNADNTCSLQMGILSLVVLDAINPLARQAADEANLKHRGYTYEDLLKQRTAPSQLLLR